MAGSECGTLVHVVIPAFEASRFLGESIGSVLRAADHAGCAVDLVVVDDGSTDDTGAIAEAIADPIVTSIDGRTSMQVIRQVHRGAAHARNAGIGATSAATPPFLAFLDADDVWTHDALRVRLDAFAADPDLDLVVGHMVEFDDATGAERAAVPAWSVASMVVRRAAFDRVGLFDTRWMVGEFVDWYARAQDVGLAAAMLPDVVLRRRVHDANTTRLHRREYPLVLAEIRRRRLAAGRSAISVPTPR